MPFQKNNKRDYKRELEWEKEHKPERVKQRAERNKARALVTASKGAAAVKGKDVDHKTPLSKGGKTVPNNLRIQTPAKNRSFARNKNGSMK